MWNWTSGGSLQGRACSCNARWALLRDHLSDGTTPQGGRYWAKPCSVGNEEGDCCSLGSSLGPRNLALLNVRVSWVEGATLAPLKVRISFHQPYLNSIHSLMS